MTAAVAIVPFVNKTTREQDGLASLSAGYREGFTSGSSVAAMSEAIAKANGIPWNTPAVDAWVFGLSKKRFPFDPKDNPGMYGGLKNVGWAYFAAGNVIKLPDVTRDGDRVDPAPVQTVAIPQQPSSKMPLIVGGAILLVLLLAASGGKKNKAAAVP
jgi:hypothetical protein